MYKIINIVFTTRKMNAKNELVPYIGANGYEELSGLNMLVNDIITNSCIKFDNVLLFNNEEM